MAIRTDPIAMPDLAGLEYGGARMLRLDSIDEDPDQPRTEFDAAALEELASTIRSRGVLQPVSVRAHPRSPGRWMLNFGSRRYRASRIAGRDAIPAFVDESFDSYAQVIENEQREPLQPLELALFVRNRIALGETQADIARLLGKSKAYISMAHALIAAPDWLMRVYREGRCRGLSELYQLRRMHDRAATTVESWCEGRGDLGRAEVQALGRVLGMAKVADLVSSSESVRPRPTTASSEKRSVNVRRGCLLATYDGSTVEVVTEEAPDEPRTIFVVHRASRERIRVPAKALTLIGFEGSSSP